MPVYYCASCGEKILEAGQIAGEKTLLSIPGYSCGCFLLKPGAENEPPLALLKHRNDDLLPEVWSCCRITAMRSPRDNPPDGVLVYNDRLVEVPDGDAPESTAARSDAAYEPAPRRLTEADFDAAIASGSRPENAGRLYVVKFTALWCPPCRVMDHVFASIIVARDLPGVEFFEVDADVEQDLADRFLCPSLPYLVFFRNGRRLDITRAYLGAINGGFSGYMSEAEFRALCRKVMELPEPSLINR